jgi:hypothetical protein
MQYFEAVFAHKCRDITKNTTILRGVVLQTKCSEFSYSMHSCLAQVPQQDNHCDCGVYVLEYIERFSQEFTKAESVSVREWTDQKSKDWFKKKDIKTKRAQIMSLLDRLHSEYIRTLLPTSNTGDDIQEDDRSRQDGGEDGFQVGGNKGAGMLCEGGQSSSPDNQSGDYIRSSSITSMQGHHSGRDDQQHRIMQECGESLETDIIQNNKRKRGDMDDEDDEGEELS